MPGNVHPFLNASAADRTGVDLRDARVSPYRVSMPVRRRNRSGRDIRSSQAPATSAMALAAAAALPEPDVRQVLHHQHLVRTGAPLVIVVPNVAKSDDL
jgi:hypothetical protein